MNDPLEEKLLQDILTGRYKDICNDLVVGLALLTSSTELTNEILNGKFIIKGFDPVVHDPNVFHCKKLVQNNRLVIYRLVSQKLAEIIRLLRPDLRV